MIRSTMTRRIWFLNITFFLSAHWCITEAGPVERSVRVLREVYPEIEPEKVERNQPKVCIVQSLVYGVDETVPSDQPCLSCKCQPPDVHCETKLCALKPGCRAIHKPNKCCPEYQCECEHEGKTYANGERLETTPGGECKVCYCRGGEVQCAEVSCYIRTDCEGRLVQGQCCPKYEHCPPIDSPSDKVQLKPEPHNKSTPEPTITSTIDPIANSSAENEIVETTTVLENAPVKKSHKPEITEASTEDNDKAHKSTQTEDLQNEEPPKITIHEIIPETTLTASPVDVHQQFVGTNQSNDVAVLDSELESSEVSEVFQVPPVLRIGDKLLFLKKGELVPEKDASTPSPVFTIIGAEGLQRGDVDSLEHHEQIKDHADIETTTILAEPPKEKDQPNITINEETKESTTNATEDGSKIVIHEVNTNGSNVESVVKPTEVDATTEKGFRDRITTENAIKSQTLNSTIDVAVELATVPNFDTSSASQDRTTNSPIDANHTITHTETEETKVKSDEVILENPAYPPIPDIMSEQGTEYVEMDVKDESAQKTSDVKILPDILDVRNNQTIPQNVTNIAWLKAQPTGKDLNDDVLPEFVIKQLAPVDLETTTVDATTTVDVNELEQISSRQPPIDSFITEDLLKFGTIVEIDPLAQNHIKKLAADDDVSGILTQPTPDDVYEIKSRSTETLESVSVEDSGENTTPKTSGRKSYNEDASLAAYGEDTSESKSSEATSTKPKFDVEMIDSAVLKPGLIDANSTHQQKESSGRVDKRTVNYDAESEKIFQELDSEIQLMSGGFVDVKSEDEKKKEAQDIFKELLDEVNSSSTSPKTPESPHVKEQSVVLRRVSDAIAKFQVQEDRRTLGSNILGILRDFFSSQSYK